MISVRESDNDLFVDFNDHEDYDSFDDIISLLKKYFTIQVLEQLDGPESRVWKMLIENVPISLHNNPYGNFLKATTQESKEKLRSLLPKIKIYF